MIIPSLWEKYFREIVIPCTLHIETIEPYGDMRLTLEYQSHVMQTQIDGYNLVKQKYPIALINETINTLKRDFRNYMESTVGNIPVANYVANDYPDIREWARLHFRTNFPNNLNGPIPGWVFQRWKEAHPGLKAGKNGGVTPTLEGIEGMVARKVVVQKGAVTKNPRTVKKPMCPVHLDTVMVFNAVRSVWECQHKGCHIIAQPKNEPEQGKILLGKGEVSLRVVCQEGRPPAIVLISDDNVALDITNHVTLTDIDNSFDMNSVVNRARKAGADSTSIPIAKFVSIGVKASVVNISYWPDDIKPF